MSELAANAPLRRAALLTAIALLSLLAAARADTVTGDHVRIGFRARIHPTVLPRSNPAPVSLRVAATVQPLSSERPAALTRLTVQVNRHAHFTTRGLPSCSLRKLRGTSTRQALANCRGALIGRGQFTSHIDIPEQAPFPAYGRALAFKTIRRGHPAVAIHIYGRTPASITTVLASSISRSGPASGPFGPWLSIEMPRIGGDWGYVSSFDLTFHRRFRYRGRERSVLSANCPAPAGIRVVPFTAARGTFQLTDGQTLTRTLGGSCRATG
jgi:hypothetical protein